MRNYFIIIIILTLATTGAVIEYNMFYNIANTVVCDQDTCMRNYNNAIL